MTPAAWVSVLLGFGDLIDRQEALFQLRCESKKLPHRQAVGHFVFFQVGITPAAYMTVVLGFRDLIDRQEALFTTKL